MTVSELIDKLRGLPGDIEACVTYTYYDSDTVPSIVEGVFMEDVEEHFGIDGRWTLNFIVDGSYVREEDKRNRRSVAVIV